MVRRGVVRDERATARGRQPGRGRKVQYCHAERSEASRCLASQTLRGVYPEHSEGLRVTRFGNFSERLWGRPYYDTPGRPTWIRDQLSYCFISFSTRLPISCQI